MERNELTGNPGVIRALITSVSVCLSHLLASVPPLFVRNCPFFSQRLNLKPELGKPSFRASSLQTQYPEQQCRSRAALPPLQAECDQQGYTAERRVNTSLGCINSAENARGDPMLKYSDFSSRRFGFIGWWPRKKGPERGD